MQPVVCSERQIYIPFMKQMKSSQTDKNKKCLRRRKFKQNIAQP